MISVLVFCWTFSSNGGEGATGVNDNVNEDTDDNDDGVDESAGRRNGTSGRGNENELVGGDDNCRASGNGGNSGNGSNGKGSDSTSKSARRNEGWDICK